MGSDFATSKVRCQAETLLLAIGINGASGDNGTMGKVPSRRPRRANPPAYVREWLRAFGLKPAEVARAAEVNEGYLSQLISGQKNNPSPGFLMDLAGVMPQPFHYTQFYKPPPDDAALKALASIDPALLPFLKPRH
jgi:hypothetical protein